MPHHEHADARIADVQVVGDVEPAADALDVDHAGAARGRCRQCRQADVGVRRGDRGAVGDGEVGGGFVADGKLAGER